MSLFLFGAVVYAVMGVVAAMLMLRELRRRGVEVDWPRLRLHFFRYLEEYRELTRRETGETKLLYYLYIVSMLLALACAVVALVLAVL